MHHTTQHGNGTEEIVRCLTPQQHMLPLPPSCPPQIINIYKPWLDVTDAADVFFGSINLVNGTDFYPGSGQHMSVSSNSSGSSDASSMPNM
jgi:acetoin utilization deacetylase AcuC-like enzyme